MATFNEGFQSLKASFGRLDAVPTKSFLANLGTHTSQAQGFLGKAGGFVVDVLLAIPKTLAAVASTIIKPVFAFSVGAVKAVGKFAVAVVEQPASGAMKITGAAVRGVRRHPIAAGVAAAGVAGYGLLNLANGRAAANTQNDLMAQATSAQNDVVAAAQGAPVSYKNSVLPSEAAELAARQAGSQGASHAQTVDAARAATPQTAAAL